MPRVTCPKCDSVLELDDDMMGDDVQCGSCQAVFRAEADRPSSRPSSKRDEPDERPSRRKARDVDEGSSGAPRRSSRRDEADEDDDRPSRRRERDYDDENDEGGRRRSRRNPGTGMAIASLVIGIISLPMIFAGFCCPVIPGIFGVVGLILGFLALKTEGRGMAIGGICTSSIGILGSILLAILFLIGNAANNNNGGNNGQFGPQPQQKNKFK